MQRVLRRGNVAHPLLCFMCETSENKQHHSKMQYDS